MREPIRIWIKKIRILNILFFLVVISILLLAKEESRADNSIVQVLLVPWGSRAGEVGFIQRAKGGEDQGPNSFFVTEKKIYILDTVNRRIIVYKEGILNKQIRLTTKYYPLDFYVDNNDIYLVTNLTVEKISNGKVVSQKKILGEKNRLDNRIEMLFKVKDLIVVSSWNETTKGNFACFESKNLNFTSCGKLDDLFRQFDVLDMTSNGKLIASADDNLWFLSLEGKLEKLGEKPSIDELYPVIRYYRFHNGSIYTMNPEQNHLIFNKIVLN